MYSNELQAPFLIPKHAEIKLPSSSCLPENQFTSRTSVAAFKNTSAGVYPQQQPTWKPVAMERSGGLAVINSACQSVPGKAEEMGWKRWREA